MEYETNGVGSHFDDSLMAKQARERDTPSPEHMEIGKASSTTAPTPPLGEREPAIAGNDFFFGNKNNGDVNALVQPGYKSNGDQFSSNDSNDIEQGIEHDDFGPETDVDATDDAAISPISSSVSIFSITNSLFWNSLAVYHSGFDFNLFRWWFAATIRFHRKG